MNTSVQASRHAKKHINKGYNATLPYEDSKIIVSIIPAVELHTPSLMNKEIAPSPTSLTVKLNTQSIDRHYS